MPVYANGFCGFVGFDTYPRHQFLEGNLLCCHNAELVERAEVGIQVRLGDAANAEDIKVLSGIKERALQRIARGIK